MSDGHPPVRVVHLINDLDDGGAQTMLCKLLEHRHDDRVEHRVITLLDGGVNHGRVLDAGVPLEQLGFARGKASFAVWRRLAGVLRRHRPCVVQAWLYHANLAAVASRLPMDRQAPMLWNIRHSLHDLSQEKASTRYVIRANGLFARLADKVVYCSRASVQQHVDVGFSQKNVIVIPNGFDCDAFKPRAGAREALVTELGIDPSAGLVGMAARYHPMKDHELLLSAVAGLRAEGLKPHLVLAGKGVEPGHRALGPMIERLGLEDHVSLLGYRRDMAGLIAGLDVYALSSRWGEGFPNVIGEAMASGVPAAATDVGDSRWIIGETGKVVAPGDLGAFTHQALGPLLSMTPAERAELGVLARARIQNDFSIDAVVAQYEQLYLEVGQHLPALAA